MKSDKNKSNSGSSGGNKGGGDKDSSSTYKKDDSDIILAMEQMNIMKKNLGAAVEHIIDNATDLNEAQSQLISAVKSQFEDKEKSGLEPGKAEELEKKITQDISGFIGKISKKKRMSPGIDKINGNDKADLLTTESRKNLKRIMKNFVVYEIYKVMNPKRIAGETEKDNYQHNLIHRGEKRASDYEGGRENEKYGSMEVKRMKGQAAKVTKSTGFEL